MRQRCEMIVGAFWHRPPERVLAPHRGLVRSPTGGLLALCNDHSLLSPFLLALKVASFGVCREFIWLAGACATPAVGDDVGLLVGENSPHPPTCRRRLETFQMSWGNMISAMKSAPPFVLYMGVRSKCSSFRAENFIRRERLHRILSGSDSYSAGSFDVIADLTPANFRKSGNHRRPPRARVIQSAPGSDFRNEHAARLLAADQVCVGMAVGGPALLLEFSEISTSGLTAAPRSVLGNYENVL
jgi:hypothetical protein